MFTLWHACANSNSDLWMLRHYYNLESGTFMTIWWEQSVSLHLKLLTWTEYGPPLSVLLLLPITSILFQYIRPLSASQILFNVRNFSQTKLRMHLF